MLISSWGDPSKFKTQIIGNICDVSRKWLHERRDVVVTKVPLPGIDVGKKAPPRLCLELLHPALQLTDLHHLAAKWETKNWVEWAFLKLDNAGAAQLTQEELLPPDGKRKSRQKKK